MKALRLSWLVPQLHARKLPCCQDLPAAAIMPVDELRSLFGSGNDQGNGEVLPLIAVSSRGAPWARG